MNHQFNHMEDPIVPHHDALRSGDSFKVPESYFNSLTDRIMNRVEYEVVPTVLKEKIFSTPDNYFETFTDRLMVRIHPQQSSKTIRTGFRRMIMFSAAAVVVILVSWFVINLFRNQTTIDYLADSSEEELLEYVSTYSYQFDQNTLADLINEDVLNSLELLDVVDDETSDLLIELYQ